MPFSMLLANVPIERAEQPFLNILTVTPFDLKENFTDGSEDFQYLFMELSNEVKENPNYKLE